MGLVVKKEMIPFHEYIIELFDRPYPVYEYERLDIVHKERLFTFQ